MSGTRPGTKVRLWSPRFTNRPDVEPPALLKLVGAISIFSVVGALSYAIAMALAGPGSSKPVGVEEIYVAVLHFVLPLCVFYTISVNSPLSRFVIGFYMVLLGFATIAGKGFLGGLPFPESTRVVITVAVMAAIFYWLFGSPKMRFYYAVISSRPVPDSLKARAEELQGGIKLSPRATSILEWIIDRAETAVLLGFIVAVLYAFWSMG